MTFDPRKRLSPFSAGKFNFLTSSPDRRQWPLGSTFAQAAQQSRRAGSASKKRAGAK